MGLYLLCKVVIFTFAITKVFSCSSLIQSQTNHQVCENRSHKNESNPKEIEVSTRILVTNGDHRNAQKSEVIDISDHNIKCNNLPDFPFENRGLTGFLFNNVPVICGGKIQRSDYSDQCFVLHSSGEFLPFLTMSEKKSFSAASVYAKEMYLFGGMYNGKPLNTVEKISNGSISRTFPLPNNQKLYGACSVTLGSKIYVIGGNNGKSDLDQTLVFDPQNSRFEHDERLHLNHARSDHGCTTFLSPVHQGRQVIIVAGGFPYRKFVEVLDPQENRWKEIIDLPVSFLHGPKLLPTPRGDGVIAIYGKKIFKLVIDSAIQLWVWEEMPQRLEVHRSAFTAMFLPSSFTTCQRT